MTADIATAPPEFITRSLDANWSYTRWLQLPDDGNHSVTFAQSHELRSPTLPTRAAVASFFAGSPDETV